ncbi:MAG: S-layer homology domain-containing protein [Candidatus Peregrinibacteria bacterium]|nr:S-layer homology domain-containing protein [Candidatus Peregrinibacteria bacterium]
MKKFSIFLFFCIFISATFTEVALAKTPNSTDWYQFNSNSSAHRFQFRFPRDWQLKTLDDKTELLSPIGTADSKLNLVVQEFNDQSYNSVINYFVTQDQLVIEVKDIFVQAQDEDLIGKQANYQNKSTGEKEVVTLFKRGRTIITISNNINSFSDVYNQIINSFDFNDKWHSYIDVKKKFSFIYPSDFILVDGISQVDVKPSSTSNSIFTVAKNQTKPKIIYADQKLYKEDSIEIMDSFSFFDLDLTGKLHAYQNFSDVTDLQPNAKAINLLYKDGIIKGYDDGKFRPDGEVTRAELTKMIVSALSSPGINDFNSCFPDVKKEWFAPYVCYAKDHKWISGFSDGQFHPNDKVTRVEAIKIIVNGFFNGKIVPEELKNNSANDIKLNEWYGKYFIFSDNRDLLDKQHVLKNGSSYAYLPLKNITRKEVAETIFRIKNLPN